MGRVQPYGGRVCREQRGSVSEREGEGRGEREDGVGREGERDRMQHVIIFILSPSIPPGEIVKSGCEFRRAPF